MPKHDLHNKNKQNLKVLFLFHWHIGKEKSKTPEKSGVIPHILLLCFSNKTLSEHEVGNQEALQI